MFLPSGCAPGRRPDAVAERLAIALTEGRLDLDEYHHRLTRAMNAVVIGDLLPLVADLPEPKRTEAVPARSRERIPPRRGKSGSTSGGGGWAARSS